jgi:hypothetical protein
MQASERMICSTHILTVCQSLWVIETDGKILRITLRLSSIILGLLSVTQSSARSRLTQAVSEMADSSWFDRIGWKIGQRVARVIGNEGGVVVDVDNEGIVKVK